MDKEYKYKISISLRRKDRTINLYTDDDTFNKTKTFTSRRSIRIPTNVIGIGEDFDDGGGGIADSWKEMADRFGILNSQDIIDIEINDVSINDEYKKIVEAYGYTILFPLLYHFQITSEELPCVVNWYPTTGSTTIQVKGDKYSTESVGHFDDIEDLLIYIKDNL